MRAGDGRRPLLPAVGSSEKARMPWSFGIPVYYHACDMLESKACITGTS